MKKEILVLLLWIVYLTTSCILIYSMMLKCNESYTINGIDAAKCKFVQYLIIGDLFLTAIFWIDTRIRNLACLNTYPDICHKYLYPILLLTTLAFIITALIFLKEVNMTFINYWILISMHIVQFAIFVIALQIIYMDND